MFNERFNVAERVRERERFPEKERFHVPVAYKTARAIQMAAQQCVELDYRLKQLAIPEAFDAASGKPRPGLGAKTGGEGEAGAGADMSIEQGGEDGGAGALPDIEKAQSDRASKSFAQSYLATAFASCSSSGGGESRREK
eukprot:g8282.t1